VVKIHGHATYDESLRVIAQERPPALRLHAVTWCSVEVLRHVLADGAWRDLQTELEPQLVGDASLPPCKVVARHLPDERLQLRGDRGPSWLGWPAPE